MTDQNKREELSGAVEDAFGFNFRSLKTLAHLLFLPNRVFKSYAARDQEYSPAIRLWFGLIGVQVLVSALWGGWAGIMRRQIENGDPAVGEMYTQISGGRVDAFTSHYGDAMGVGQPLLVAGFTALSVFVLGWFRRGLSWPARLNIAMGVLAAGSFAGLLLMPTLIFPQFAQIGWAAPVVIAVAYFLTFLRGAPGVLADTTGGAWIKAFVYALVLVFLVVLAGAVLAILATVYALFRLGPA